MRDVLNTMTWTDFSDAFTRLYGLPSGAALRLFQIGNSKRKRSDFQVKVKTLSKRSLKNLADTDNVRALLDKVPLALSTKLADRRLRCELYSPAGDLINGNTLLRTVRAMPGAFDDLLIDVDGWDDDEPNPIPEFQIILNDAIEIALGTTAGIEVDIAAAAAQTLISSLGKPAVRAGFKRAAL